MRQVIAKLSPGSDNFGLAGGMTITILPPSPGLETRRRPRCGHRYRTRKDQVALVTPPPAAAAPWATSL